MRGSTFRKFLKYWRDSSARPTPRSPEIYQNIISFDLINAKNFQPFETVDNSDIKMTEWRTISLNCSRLVITVIGIFKFGWVVISIRTLEVGLYMALSAFMWENLLCERHCQWHVRLGWRKQALIFSPSDITVSISAKLRSPKLVVSYGYSIHLL